ncbi:protein D3 [Bemisia tabaci]|uniref:protein D3 n=1 Tax=Bemisia tabaci TaxID=7038 RepID=UPI003B2892C9
MPKIIPNSFGRYLLKGLLMTFNIGSAVPTTMTLNKMTPAAMKDILLAFDVFPTQLDNVPNYPITVEYRAGSVNFGTNFTETQVYEIPTQLSWPVEENMRKEKKLFTMLLYGPDVPTRENPLKKYHWIHWIIINIPGNSWRKGQVVTEYRAWQPFYTNDVHRCIYLVYPQEAEEPIVYNETIVTTTSSDELRGFFNKDVFARKYNLEMPYAINFFQLHLNGSEEEGNIWN